MTAPAPPPAVYGLDIETDTTVSGLDPAVSPVVTVALATDRAAACGVTLGLRLVPDPTVILSHDPLSGHEGAYRATWHAHRHVDGYRMYRGDVGRILGISCSLKAIARFVGLTPVEVDRERIHELGTAELDAYVASDARLTRMLVERRRAGLPPFVDSHILP